MAEKTEKATPKKLKDARKKGQVAKIQDLPAAFTFIVSISATLMFLSYFFNQIGAFTISIFREVSNAQENFEAQMPIYFLSALEVIINCSFPILLFVCVTGVLVSFLVIGPVFSFQSMKFDLKKLNPIEGIKQKFKVKVLVDLIKSIVKITGAGLIIYFIIMNMLPQIISSVVLPVVASAGLVHDFLIKAAIQVGLFFLLVALFDLAFQKKNFAKEMMMEKFEIKQEYKDTEGDPHIKGHRKQLQREIAYQEGPSAAKKARAIITNPTHIAVAIKYDPEVEPAPIILTMGVGLFAEQIIKIGVENKIPIMRNVDLARALYSKGKISDYVPEDTYQAIAEILKWIDSLENNPDMNTELFK
jgi:type III secretion protein U